MSQMLPVAETFPAISWACTECNRLNYTQFETTDADERQLIYRSLHGLDNDEPLPPSWNSFNMLANVTRMPHVISCIACKKNHIPHNLTEASK